MHKIYDVIKQDMGGRWYALGRTIGKDRGEALMNAALMYGVAINHERSMIEDWKERGLPKPIVHPLDIWEMIPQNTLDQQL